MSSDQKTLYSQGLNFASYIKDGVDQRTGQYTCTVNLFEAPSEARNLPPLKLSLAHNPLNHRDAGFGIGWSLNLSSYQHRAEQKVLHLSTGEHYQVTQTGSHLTVKDQKLKNFHFLQKGSNYQLAHKSGLVETLSNASNTYKTTVPVRLEAANGRSLTLRWSQFDGEPRLSSIHDGSDVLLRVDYQYPRVTVTRSPNTSEKSTLTFRQQGHTLQEFKTPTPDLPPWRFSYKTFPGATCVTTVSTPTGLVENITYEENGHRLPPGAPYQAIPCVKTHAMHPGNDQPSMRTVYTFSTKNFMGYDSGYDWKAGEDNLYRAGHRYEYTSTASVDGGSQTTNTYNNYHLMICSDQKQGTKHAIQKFTYHALPNKPFEFQPAQYQLPQTVETTYKDTASQGASRTETIRHSFDEWGNPTREVQANGIQIDRTYYAADGEDGSCPPDPHGFQRYLKTETVTPAQNSNSTPKRSKHHTYTKLPTAPGASVGSLVVVQQKQELQDGSCISIADFAYANKPDSRDHGRTQQKVTKISEEYPCTETFTHQYPNTGTFRTTTQTTSFDSKKVSEEITVSLWDGTKRSHKDHANIETTFQYDSAGRQVKTTIAPGTAYEAAQKHQYAAVQQKAGQCVTVTDAKGMQTRYTTDGMRRVVQIERQDDSGQWSKDKGYSGTFRVVERRGYNAQNQYTRRVQSDYISVDSGLTEKCTETGFAYDDWGEIDKVTTSSGVVHLSTTDPISLTQIKGIQGEGQTKTEFNLFGSPKTISLLNRDGTLRHQKQYSYNGLGHLVHESDNSGHEIKYDLDCFDRVVQTTRPNVRQTRTDYAPHSSAAWPVSIKNNNLVTGRQSIDGLGRVMSQTVGGRTTTRSYKDGNPKPSMTTTPAGDQHRLTHEPALGYALTKRSSTELADTYQYDGQSAAVKQHKNTFASENVEYYPSGLPRRRERQISGGDKLSDLAQYSMNGKLLKYVDLTGDSRQMNYDRFSRLEKVIQGQRDISLKYDDKCDRVSSTHLEDHEHSMGLRFSQSYDDFGHETSRTVYKGDDCVYELSQSYDTNGLISSRTLQDGGTNVLRHETFKYDSLDRLTDYNCSGAQLPRDGNEKPFVRQTFTFDVHDNLTQVSTTFNDGTVNTASYLYSTTDPTQLSQITNTHKDYPSKINLAYNTNGCLTQDERGQKLEYDSLNRLVAVLAPNSEVLARYKYDAAGKLTCQQVRNKPDTYFSYQGDKLVGINSSATRTSYLTHGHGYWGEVIQKEGATQTSLWVTDSSQSPLAWIDSHQPDKVQLQSFTPYGLGGSHGPSIGYNGQWRDPVTGWYHLGNGTRVYNPALMRFHSPDSWAPFNSGEINAYAYSLGDPINRADPNGHSSVNLAWRTITVGVLAMIAGAIADVLTAGATLGIQIAVGVAVGVTTSVAGGLIYDAATSNLSWVNSLTDVAMGAIAAGMGVAGRKLIKLAWDTWGPQLQAWMFGVKGSLSGLEGDAAFMGKNMLDGPLGLSDIVGGVTENDAVTTSIKPLGSSSVSAATREAAAGAVEETSFSVSSQSTRAMLEPTASTSAASTGAVSSRVAATVPGSASRGLRSTVSDISSRVVYRSPVPGRGISPGMSEGYASGQLGREIRVPSILKASEFTHL